MNRERNIYLDNLGSQEDGLDCQIDLPIEKAVERANRLSVLFATISQTGINVGAIIKAFIGRDNAHLEEALQSINQKTVTESKREESN